MKSRIINMGDYTMDEQDRALQQMFAAKPVADNGFSAAVMKRVRRRILLQRLVLPIAVVFGGLVAIGPLMDLAALLPQVAQPAPGFIAWIQDALGPMLASVVGFLPPIALLIAALRLIEE